MSARSIRRAAERKAAKEARKAQRETSPVNAETRTRAEINRANAQKSTGPCTIIGKEKSRFNAVRHNLTGRTVMLPSEDATLYAAHCQDLHNELKPVGVREQFLVQSIADSYWRLNRIPSLEAALYAIALVTESENPGEDAQASSTDIQTYLKYEKSLRNLHLQESRLRRHLKNDLAELKELQAARQPEEKKEVEAEPAQTRAATPQGVGFVFSNPQPAPENDPSTPLLSAEKPDLTQEKAA